MVAISARFSGTLTFVPNQPKSHSPYSEMHQLVKTKLPGDIELVYTLNTPTTSPEGNGDEVIGHARCISGYRVKPQTFLQKLKRQAVEKTHLQTIYGNNAHWDNSPEHLMQFLRMAIDHLNKTQLNKS